MQGNIVKIESIKAKPNKAKNKRDMLFFLHHIEDRHGLRPRDDKEKRFEKNKANLPAWQIGLSVYLKGFYADISPLRARKNKAKYSGL